LDGKRTASGALWLRSLERSVDRLLTVRRVADRLGFCTATVYKLVDRSELAHVRVANAIRIAPADLADFIRSKRRK
jgi:excisionase family DNA binding protein